MALEITTRHIEDVVILDLDGRITLGDGSVSLREAIRKLVAEGQKKVMLNLEKVAYVDSSGFGEIRSAFVVVSNNEGQLRLFKPGTRVGDLLHLTQIVPTHIIYYDEESALRHF